MIPRRAVQRSLESVGVRLLGSNGALGNGWHSVLPLSSLLPEAVPMQGRAFGSISDVVMDGDLDPVTPVGLDGRSGESSIDQKHLSLVAIGSNDTAADSEVVLPGDAGVRPLLVVVGAVRRERAPGNAVGQGVVVQELRKLGSTEGAKRRLSVNVISLLVASVAKTWHGE